MLDEEHGVIVSNGRLEQPLGVRGGARRDHLQPREVGEDHIRRLGMGRAQLPPAAADRADHEGQRIWPLNM